MQPSKRALQCLTAIGGFIPVGAGLAGIILGPQMIESLPTSTSLDSHFSYLSGLLLGIGFCFWSLIPNIERHGARVRMLTFIVVVGGLGRVWSLLTVGAPNTQMLLALVMELIITPALAYWQYRLSRSMP